MGVVVFVFCLVGAFILQKEHKLKVFAGARVCFVGFPEDETQHMAEVLVNNGGTTCPLDDSDCTHVVSTFYLRTSLLFLLVIC